jgi:hypothetical protein
MGFLSGGPLASTLAVSSMQATPTPSSAPPGLPWTVSKCALIRVVLPPVFAVCFVSFWGQLTLATTLDIFLYV